MDHHKTLTTMFNAPFNFEGRIRRREYGISFIIFFVCFDTIDSIIDSSEEAAFLQLLFIPLYWFFIAQGVKRCHDINRAGWFQVIPFYVFALLFSDSDKGENQYGLNPKEYVPIQQEECIQ